MHKKPKRFLFYLSGFGALLIILIVWAIRPVDNRPYFLSGYYQNTRARLDSLINQSRLTTGPLEIGMAAISTTPALQATRDLSADDFFPEVPLAGYGDRRGRPAQGVHDSLFMKAVAMRVGDQVAFLITWDGLIFPPEVAELALETLQADFPLQRAQVLFSATHTHCGIGGWGEGFLAEQFAGAYNAAIRRWLANQAARVLKKAYQDLTPAAVAGETFRAGEFVRNRLVGELGWVDDEFQLIVFRQIDGDYAVLGIFSAHATVLSEKVMVMSGDYPGYWQRALERRIPGMALFFAGGVGSHGPAGKGHGFERARHIGESLADSVLAYLGTLRFHDNTSLAYIGLPVDLPERHFRLSDGLRLNPKLASYVIPYENTYLQAIRIDSLIWIGTPCDFSGELALDLRRFAREQGFDAVITSFNAGYVGYVIPGKYYHFNAYESRLMSFYGPYMGDYFDELIRRLIRGMSRLSPESPAAR